MPSSTTQPEQDPERDEQDGDVAAIIGADGTRLVGQRHGVSVHPHEPVARERGDGLGVARLRAGDDRAERRRAPLAERALERALPAQSARSGGRATGTPRRAGRRRSGGRARGRRSCRDPSAPARPPGENVVAGALRDAPHVDVDGQHVAAEREARDGVGGVAADAGQLGQVVGPAVRRDLLRGAVERERAPVVAEPLPLADHVAGRRRGERLDRRPALEPALASAARRARPASAAP